MAKTSLKIRNKRTQKFKTREYTRCERCGRPHSVSVSYTHLDAADDLLCVDLGGRRIIKKKKTTNRKRN